MILLQWARWTVGLAWIYQGLLPKLIFVAESEQALASAMGVPESWLSLFVRTAGVLELLFGVALLIYYRYWPLLVLNNLALVGLLLITAILMPAFLFGAFNPVTTNLPLLLLSYYLYSEAKSAAKNA